MKHLLPLLLFVLLPGCASLQQARAKIQEPYEQLRYGMAIVCTVDPDVIPAEQRAQFVRGCVIAADAIERTDAVLRALDGAPPPKPPTVEDPQTQPTSSLRRPDCVQLGTCALAEHRPALPHRPQHR